MPEVQQAATTAPPTAGGFPAKLAFVVLVLVAAAIVVVAPSFLDTYLVNILIRAFFVAMAAITVDIMWGYCGTLTFGQSAFFGIGVYALAIVFTEYGFGTWQAFAGAWRHACSHGCRRRAHRMAFVLPGLDAALCLDRIARRSDRPRPDPLFRRHVHGLVQRSGRLRDRSIWSWRTGFGLPASV